jgi:hypothetical protein
VAQDSFGADNSARLHAPAHQQQTARAGQAVAQTVNFGWHGLISAYAMLPTQKQRYRATVALCADHHAIQDFREQIWARSVHSAQ